MIETREIKAADSTLKLSVDSEHMPEIYADAVAEQMMGIPVSKLLFYIATGVQENTVSGKAVCRLIMPTSTLLDLARQLVAYAEANQEQLKSSLLVHEKTMLSPALKTSKKKSTK